ncbi:hypothetical protein GCM10018771_23940 [Streptomyces cellulosae]|nr:hypothetical protein GCM10018771_23940 [Streptomyces cellulosae]
MTSSAPSPDDLPVYDRLVRERGDVVAEVREVAERTQFEVRQALAGTVRPRPPQNGPRQHQGPGGPRHPQGGPRQPQGDPGSSRGRARLRGRGRTRDPDSRRGVSGRRRGPNFPGVPDSSRVPARRGVLARRVPVRRVPVRRGAVRRGVVRVRTRTGPGRTGTARRTAAPGATRSSGAPTPADP